MYAGDDDYEYRGEVPPELRRGRSGGPPRGRRDGPYGPPDRPPRRRRRLRRWALWCAVVLLLPFSVPLVFRGLDADGPSPVPQLLAFLPWFLAPAWLGLVCAILARRVLVLLWAAAVLGSTGWFLQPYGPDAPPPRQEPATARFRVLTANLEHGDATGALLGALRRERPHLVSVQECDRRCAAALRTTAVRDAYPYRVVLPGDSAAAGSALLSSRPLRTLPPVPGTLTMPGALVEFGGATVRVQVAHPMPPLFRSVGPWRRELGALRDYAAAHRAEPLLMAGDFNASQDHAAFRALLETGLRDAARLEGRSRTPTWPTATAPPLGAQIDHVLVSEEFEVRDAVFLDLRGSDHRALLADVKLFAGG
ncbi:endonuclease/exonuclease/phosphatase family protein [Streptomyces sp. JJ36]|uniref:endonuclease/exonuclease/phosphatase family protein n=1 Tax=Streptomyces sp. JJ36 TaxID=2736645 RepID=UPI001F31F64B|nr:endonuclease/exonuclease/phosphatase family protein [Streptomyces sp. JJ36]